MAKPRQTPGCGSSPRPWGTQGCPAARRRRRRFIPTSVGNTTHQTAPAARRPVHPHVRGEHGVTQRRASFIARFIPTSVGNTRAGCKCLPDGRGSSPRPWGTRRRPAARARRSRFIPTSVGNTFCKSKMPCKATVHPHVRGEHDDGRRYINEYLGSSPRPWGTLCRAAPAKSVVRFIPTSVGNTLSRRIGDALGAVHPHVRGEHNRQELVKFRTTGSSPRPWGTPCSACLRVIWPRFIPTSVGNTPGWLASANNGPVHPHVRGEHLSVHECRRAMGGSSPRPWGTRKAQVDGQRVRRFIPTSVGNTASSKYRRDVLPVHPHVRGEHAASIESTLTDSGSSPRPWGTRRRTGSRRRPWRFIPTSVGNTMAARCRRAFSTVHPHVRGEHTATHAYRIHTAGSSPRPWGTRSAGLSSHSPTRFIPTSVGNTRRRQRRDAPGAVHPHVRGEHEKVGPAPAAMAGSSPRPWGTPIRPLPSEMPLRFIPTSVGNIFASQSWLTPSAVHPHVRGEHSTACAQTRSSAGSSPRPWGTLVEPSFDPLPVRFIPTSVGNTTSTSSKLRAAPVHPHVRGEHGTDKGFEVRDYGSSPRPWGTLGKLTEEAKFTRFIPTSVGNTPRRRPALTTCSVHPHVRGEHLAS